MSKDYSTLHDPSDDKNTLPEHQHTVRHTSTSSALSKLHECHPYRVLVVKRVTKWSLTCHSKKSLSLTSPDVLTSKSGAQDWYVYKHFSSNLSLISLE